MKIFLLTLCIFFHSSTIFAATTQLNLLGTWTAISGSWSFTGTKNNFIKTKLLQEPLHPQLEIIEQKGAAFSGDFKRYDGKGPIVAGVIAPDNQHIYMSLDSSSAVGTFDQANLTLTICGTTVENTHNRAFCSIYKKDK